ncbi:hypothetical protein ACHAW6_005167 [Cyclotella cf. meneghiniana]
MKATESKKSSKRKGNGNDNILSKPKRPTSAYNYFFRDLREELKPGFSPNEEDGEPRKTLSVDEIGRIIGQRWRSLPESEVAKYKEMAKEDDMRYNEEMVEFHKNGLALLCKGKKTLFNKGLSQDVAGERDDEERCSMGHLLTEAKQGNQAHRPQTSNSTSGALSLGEAPMVRGTMTMPSITAAPQLNVATSTDGNSNWILQQVRKLVHNHQQYQDRTQRSSRCPWNVTSLSNEICQLRSAIKNRQYDLLLENELLTVIDSLLEQMMSSLGDRNTCNSGFTDSSSTRSTCELDTNSTSMFSHTKIDPPQSEASNMSALQALMLSYQSTIAAVNNNFHSSSSENSTSASTSESDTNSTLVFTDTKKDLPQSEVKKKRDLESLMLSYLSSIATANKTSHSGFTETPTTSSTSESDAISGPIFTNTNNNPAQPEAFNTSALESLMLFYQPSIAAWSNTSLSGFTKNSATIAPTESYPNSMQMVTNTKRDPPQAEAINTSVLQALILFYQSSIAAASKTSHSGLTTDSTNSIHMGDQAQSDAMKKSALEALMRSYQSTVAAVNNTPHSGFTDNSKITSTSELDGNSMPMVTNKKEDWAQSEARNMSALEALMLHYQSTISAVNKTSHSGFIENSTTTSTSESDANSPQAFTVAKKDPSQVTDANVLEALMLSYQSSIAAVTCPLTGNVTRQFQRNEERQTMSTQHAQSRPADTASIGELMRLLNQSHQVRHSQSLSSTSEILTSQEVVDSTPEVDKLQTTQQN